MAKRPVSDLLSTLDGLHPFFDPDVALPAVCDTPEQTLDALFDQIARLTEENVRLRDRNVRLYTLAVEALSRPRRVRKAHATK